MADTSPKSAPLKLYALGLKPAPGGRLGDRASLHVFLSAGGFEG